MRGVRKWLGGGGGYWHRLIPIRVAAQKSTCAACPWYHCQKEGAFSVSVHGTHAEFIDWVDRGRHGQGGGEVGR